MKVKESLNRWLRSSTYSIGRITRSVTRIWNSISKRLKNRGLEASTRVSKVSLVIGMIVALYIIGGVFVYYKVFKARDRKPWVALALQIYPFPAVIVDGRFVTVLTAYKQINYIEHFSQTTGQHIGTADEVRSKVVDRLIEGTAVSSVAKQTRLRVSDKEIQEALDKVVKENGGEKAVLEVLQSLYGMTLSEFKTLIREQLLKQKVKEHALVRVKVRHILVRDEKRAREVLDKVKGGGNFDDAAKEFSEDSNSRDKGGDLGSVNRGQLPKEVEEVVFKLKPGELAPDLAKSSLGFHILRVDARNEGTIDLSYDDFIQQFKVKHRIIRLLK